MEARTVNSLPPAGTHDDAAAFLQSNLIVAVNTPLSDKIGRYTLKPCDGKELLDLCERIRTRVARETNKRVEIVSCYKLATMANKKLTCSGRAANSSCWRCRGHGSGCDRLDLHRVAKVGQAFDQAIFLLIGGMANEVIAAEVLVHRPILEHVVDRGKD